MQLFCEYIPELDVAEHVTALNEADSRRRTEPTAHTGVSEVRWYHGRHTSLLR